MIPMNQQMYVGINGAPDIKQKKHQSWLWSSESWGCSKYSFLYKRSQGPLKAVDEKGVSSFLWGFDGASFEPAVSFLAKYISLYEKS